MADKVKAKDANRDPLTGEPGAHPVGVGVGAALGGAAAGAAAGLAAGPIGTALGAVAGGVAGGLVGKGTAEAIDPTAEDAYWRIESRNRPYYEKNAAYEVYQPAYRYGVTAAASQPNRSFDEVESDLSREWSKENKLDWQRARPAVKDAYERVCAIRMRRTK